MGHNALSKRGDMKNLIYLSTVALAFAGCDSSSTDGADGGGVVVVDAGMASNLMPSAPCAVDQTPSDLDGDMIEDVIERRTGTSLARLRLMEWRNVRGEKLILCLI